MAGCPEELVKDSDNDGTPDKNDLCPTTAGTLNGCPDSDGDGVTDNLDKCPNSAGPLTNNGCPEIKKEVKERLAFATKNVQFESGKAVLKTDSYHILEEVAGILPVDLRGRGRADTDRVRRLDLVGGLRGGEHRPRNADLRDRRQG